MAVSSISVRNLKKSFGAVDAVRDVSFNVEKGTVLGLLGPNGAGKTTTIRMLTTLLKPDGGEATIEGYDVARDADAVRSIIGLAGQYAAVDENLTGRENLIMVGQLYHMTRAEAILRAAELLEDFELTDAGDRVLKTYSGGMRRRLDLAASLINRPPVLFLDEPTTGLDPQSRVALWEIIKRLVQAGTTVLLTTQYLEEADYLADNIVVIDHGTVIASGTPRELKAAIGEDILELRISDVGAINGAVNAVRSAGATNVKVDLPLNQISFPLTSGSSMIQPVIRALDVAHIEITDLVLRHPSLDEVFLKLTGHKAEVETELCEQTV